MNRKMKLIFGATCLAQAMVILGVICVLSIKKRSIPAALIAVLGASGVAAAVMLLSGSNDESRERRMAAMDAFCDYNYFDDDNFGDKPCTCGVCGGEADESEEDCPAADGI